MSNNNYNNRKKQREQLCIQYSTSEWGVTPFHDDQCEHCNADTLTLFNNGWVKFSVCQSCNVGYETRWQGTNIKYIHQARKEVWGRYFQEFLDIPETTTSADWDTEFYVFSHTEISDGGGAWHE